MKKRIFLSLVMLLAVVCVWGENSQLRQGGRTLYYVVVGSFNSLQEARYFNNNGVGDMTYGNIYVGKANGRTVYRVCTGSYASKSQAQREANRWTQTFRDFGYYDRTAWLWPSPGRARCVERGVGNDGRTFPAF